MWKTGLTWLLAGTALLAQWGSNIEERRANVRGGGGDNGKCTIEVEVDDVAEVEIRGDVGRLRTLSGSPASWRRFECNGIPPLNPGEFRFRGIDGRGRQELISEPRGRGAAVIRIQDSKGGREGYTFDIEWRGGSGGFGSGSGSGWGNSSGSGSGWGGSGNSGGWGGSGSGSNWGGGSGELRYSGSGSGTFTNANGLRDSINNCRVFIDRSGNAEVSFRSSSQGNVTLRGRVTRSSGDRIAASMSGNGISGDMDLYTSGPNRVREIRMTGSNPVRFELRWRE